MEVMIALSLAALLLVAISGVLGGLIRQGRALDRESGQTRLYALTRLFWHDLSQAEYVAVNEGQLVLVFRNGQIVRYKMVTEKSGRSSLIRTVSCLREKRRLGEAATNLGQLEVISSQTILWDVLVVTFERIDSQGIVQPIPRTLSPCPGSLRYSIKLVESGFEREITRVVTVR
jgi:hypothetical protein